MSVLKEYFSDADLGEIKLAVKDAEAKTNAEIVPFFAETSHDYKEACFILSFCFGGLFGLSLVLYDRIYASSWSYGIMEGVLAVWMGALVGYALGLGIPMLRLLFTPAQNKLLHVQASAREAFLSEEVFRTEERIGILLYLSLRERIAVVLPDSGIAKIVPQSEWNEVIRLLVQGMRSKNRKQGIIDSIWYCGDLLEKYGIRVRKKNPNEISDELRQGSKRL